MEAEKRGIDKAEGEEIGAVFSCQWLKGKGGPLWPSLLNALSKNVSAQTRMIKKATTWTTTLPNTTSKRANL